MLVLKRRPNQSIDITFNGPDGPVYVEVMLIELHGTGARIGIQAPKDVILNRAEITDKIEAEGTRPRLARAMNLEVPTGE